MVGSISQISQLLNIETVAEAVNNADVLELLRGMGVDYAQGFWLSYPEPLDELQKLFLE